MQEITSVSNSKIKEYAKLLQKKYREESDLFLVEGQKSYEEISEANLKIIDLFVLDKDVKIKDSSIATVVSEPVMKKISSTESIPSIITVAKKKHHKIEEISNKNNIILLENIKDAGNLGTIIRATAAFEIDAILIAGDSVDIYNPKVLRSSAGNFFKTPIVKLPSIESLKEQFKDYNIFATALSSQTAKLPQEINPKEKNIIMFGAEATGLSEKLTNISDFNLLIPMSKKVESLNLSMAANIVCYEIYKSKIS